MGEVAHHSPALLLLAAFSRYEEALDWAERRAAAEFGPVLLASERFEFAETDYYQPSMGPGLKKVFLAFEQRIDPSRLAEIKLQTNAWEQAYAREAAHAEARPLNLDPGYLTLAKLVLASTKDHAHRIYLGQGIYAEVTLFFQQGQWRDRPWTFPDYRRPEYHEFFTRCREQLRRK